MKLSLGVFASPLFAISFAVGCAHAPPVALTSAQAMASPSEPPTTPPLPPVVPEVAPTSAADAPSTAAPAAPPSGELSFEQLTAQLGDDDKPLSLDSANGNGRGREIKKVSADGYQGVGVAHQAIATHEQRAGDVRVSGGLSIPQVRETVHLSAGRLRACYEAGLAQDPHLAGSVSVAFTVDGTGEVQDLDAEAASLPSEVTSCVKGAFASMTFPAPKSASVHVVYPVEFR